VRDIAQTAAFLKGLKRMSRRGHDLHKGHWGHPYKAVVKRKKTVGSDFFGTCPH